MKIQFFMTLIILLVFSLLLSTTVVFAHAVFIEPVEEGKVQVIFDDGSPNPHAEVIVFDEDENEITRGDVDREGYFSYPGEDAAILVAQDNFGHRAEYVVGEEAPQSLSRIPTVSAVLAGFMLIAVIFHYRVRRRRRTEYMRID